MHVLKTGLGMPKIIWKLYFGPEHFLSFFLNYLKIICPRFFELIEPAPKEFLCDKTVKS